MAGLSGAATVSPGSTMRTFKSGGGNSFLTSRGAYWLLALPLVLAAFALGLQVKTCNSHKDAPLLEDQISSLVKHSRDKLAS